MRDEDLEALLQELDPPKSESKYLAKILASPTEKKKFIDWLMDNFNPEDVGECTITSDTVLNDFLSLYPKNQQRYYNKYKKVRGEIKLQELTEDGLSIKATVIPKEVES